MERNPEAVWEICHIQTDLRQIDSVSVSPQEALALS